jgi:hypothetical protein
MAEYSILQMLLPLGSFRITLKRDKDTKMIKERKKWGTG